MAHEKDSWVPGESEYEIFVHFFVRYAQVGGGEGAADSDARITVVVCIVYVFVCHVRQAEATNPSCISTIKKFPARGHVSWALSITFEFLLRRLI